MKRAPYYLEMDISIYYAAEYLERGLYGREISGAGLDILEQYEYKAQKITPNLLDTAFSSLSLSDNYIPVYKKYWWFAKDPTWLRQHRFDAFKCIDRDLHTVQMANNLANTPNLENGTTLEENKVNDSPKVSKISHVMNPYETAV